MADYESLARNRPPAHVLRERIVRQTLRGRGPYDGRLPADSELNALLEEWLPPKAIQAGVPGEGRTWEDLTLHLQLPSSSPLSHALILCDEHATMTSAGQRPDYGPRAAPEIVGCLLAGKPIAGFTRSDMQDRACRALAPLVALYSAENRSRFSS